MKPIAKMNPVTQRCRPTSEDPTLEVMEIEDGTDALVAVRDIQAGEWFSVGVDSDADEGEDDGALEGADADGE
jgi:hypothetical protein